MVAPPQPLIFKDITIRGFWLVTWLRKATPKMVAEMYDRLVPMVASGSIATPIAATFPFDQVTEGDRNGDRRTGQSAADAADAGANRNTKT